MSSYNLIVKRRDDGCVELRAPAVGHWCRAPTPGAAVRSGQQFGTLELLGREHALVVPEGVGGILSERPVAFVDARPAVAYGDVLAIVSAEVEVGMGASVAATGDAATASSGLAFRSPSSGRFYLRPAPDKPPFVSVGDEIGGGTIIFLLEVMKTFSRIAYGGDDLPARARVVRILPADGDDLEPGQVVLELEAL